MRTFLTLMAVSALISTATPAFSDGAPSLFAQTATSMGSTDTDKLSIRKDLNAASEFAGRSDSIQLGFDDGGKQVSAVQFLISANADLSTADISGCAANLPESHVGGCKVKGQNILFYAFSPVNAALPSGVLGSIEGVTGSGRNLQVTVSEPVMADVDGVEMTLD